MKHQALFSSKDKGKKLKCRLLQFLYGPLRVKLIRVLLSDYPVFVCKKKKLQTKNHTNKWFNRTETKPCFVGTDPTIPGYPITNTTG